MKKLAPATKYQFKIRACKQDDKKTNNNHYGKYSGVVTAITKKSDKITQADIDAMKAELTAYSREKRSISRLIIQSFGSMEQISIHLKNF